jgi:hypothetical protein
MRIVSRCLLAVSALLLAGGGLAHALAYARASTVAEHSTMPKFFAAAFRGLWLGDALSSLALALVFAAVSLLPRLASKPLIMLIAVGPIAVAIAIFVTMGNFYAGYLTMLAGLAALSGAVLHQNAGVDIIPH